MRWAGAVLGLLWAACSSASAGVEPEVLRYFQMSCARCGSTWLNEMLATHMCLYSVGEKLNVGGAARAMREIEYGLTGNVRKSNTT